MWASKAATQRPIFCGAGVSVKTATAVVGESESSGGVRLMHLREVRRDVTLSKRVEFSQLHQVEKVNPTNPSVLPYTKPGVPFRYGCAQFLRIGDAGND